MYFKALIKQIPSRKVEKILLAMIAFALVAFILAFLLKEDLPPTEEVIPEPPLETIKNIESKQVVIEPVAIPILNADDDYIGNIFTRITIQYHYMDGSDVVLENLQIIKDSFLARMLEKDMFQKNSTLLDIEHAQDVLKDMAEQMVGQNVIKEILVEPTIHQEPSP